MPLDYFGNLTKCVSIGSPCVVLLTAADHPHIIISILHNNQKFTTTIDHISCIERNCTAVDDQQRVY